MRTWNEVNLYADEATRAAVAASLLGIVWFEPNDSRFGRSKAAELERVRAHLSELTGTDLPLLTLRTEGSSELRWWRQAQVLSSTSLQQSPYNLQRH